jgi:hypothetical protein
MTDIPKLTNNPSTFVGWRMAIETALQLADAWNAALGLDAEPDRARFILQGVTPAPASPPTTQQRTVRSDSVLPEAMETPDGAAMTAEWGGEWEKWKRRESCAQAMIKASVSMALKLDLDRMVSAEEMWTYCMRLHTLSFAEHRSEVRRKLYSLDLRGDATAEEMAAHVEHFSSLIMEGSVVGIEFSSLDQAGMFMSTILDQSFRPIVIEVNMVSETERTWPFVLSKFNAEAARRLARPVPRVGGHRNGTIVPSIGGSTRETVAHGNGRATKDISRIECYECHQKGHYARNCRSRNPGSSGEGGSDGCGAGRRGRRRRGHRGQGQGGAKEREVDKNNEGRISLSEVLFDTQATGAGLMGEEDTPTESWAVIVNDGVEFEPIAWPEDIVDVWKDKSDGAAFSTEEAVILVGEPIKPLWVVGSGATHHVTPHRGLFCDMRTLAAPKRFGLADKGSSMEATAVGSVRVKLPSGRAAKLQDVYFIPESRIGLLSLSCLLRQGWNANFKDKGGFLCHGRDKVPLTRSGSLWSVVLGTIEPLVFGHGARQGWEDTTTGASASRQHRA